MSEDMEQDQLPERLREELSRVYSQPVAVPARVNELIVSRARAELARRGRWRTLRWVGAAAAAACLVLVGRFVLLGPVSPDDIDGNRRVNIVDALVLARQIESGKGHDLNGDGAIDQQDVDAIAFSVVRLDGGVQ